MTAESIAALLEPYLAGASEPAPGWAYLHRQLVLYLELLLKWNDRTNLTAIRNPQEIVRQHFGESLFAAQLLGPCSTLLDFGSGAGFPGVPIQIFRPDIKITLAESQGKKAAFLSEAIRSLRLDTTVLPARVETLPPSLTFEVVTLRAVDHMEVAVCQASLRASRRLLLLTTPKSLARLLPAAGNFDPPDCHQIPRSLARIVAVLQRR